MPFSKYDVDPAQIEAMRAAFHKACEALELNCGPEDHITELVVMKIVEHAKAGELDPDRICSRVLSEFAKAHKTSEIDRRAREPREDRLPRSAANSQMDLRWPYQ
jgi:hypothetical protein